MSTKGASNRYGNAGYGKNGHKTIHTGYAWAKDFKKTTFGIHVKEHMKSLGLSSPESYKAHAVEFANRVDRDNHVSYVRKNGETVKFSKKTCCSNDYQQIELTGSGHVSVSEQSVSTQTLIAVCVNSSSEYNSVTYSRMIQARTLPDRDLYMGELRPLLSVWRI